MRFGITFAEPCRVLLATPAQTVSGREIAVNALAVVADQLRKTFADAHVPCLLDHHDGEITALLQGDGREVDRSVAAFARDGVHIVVGLGRQHATIEQSRQSLQDARLAMLQIERRHGGAVLRIEKSDFSRWILAGIAAEQLAPKVAHLLAEIRGHENLYETLTTYLDSDLDLGRTAVALHLHVNTVRYRLDKIERLLGRSLRRTATLADVYLAVTAQRSILGAADPTRAER
jgi:sugar diacid utilization regulator